MSNILFQTVKLNNLALKNRFVMSAAADNLEKDIKARLKRFAALASGGVGLIITGGMRIHQVDGWKEIVNVVHQCGAKIVIQLVSEPGPGRSPWSHSDQESLAVSVLSNDNPFFNKVIQYGKHREIREKEIENVIHAYALAAAKVKAMGADAIQIHAAHQNFLSQFLSPMTNKRIDQWGGSLENRTRMHREVIKAIRAEIGDDFPVLIKLGVQDAFSEGLQFDEGIKAAQLIAQSGYDIFEISQGLQDLGPVFGQASPDWRGTPMHARINSVDQEGYFREWCRQIKQVIHKPTIMTGGMRSFELIEEVIANNETDLVGMCRPFIREMDLISRWESGDHRKATCISCNKCVTELLVKGLPLECYLDIKKTKQQNYLNRQVIIEPYNESWPNKFETEKKKILSVIGKYGVLVEHIGSTAIVGMSAKPILDIMVGTKDLSTSDACIELLQTIDYEYVPKLEEDFPERRFLHRGPNLPNKHVHLHMVVIDSDFWERQLLFRDYLRQHPKAAAEYQRLKDKLAKQYKTDVFAYCEAKTECIQEILRRAGSTTAV